MTSAKSLDEFVTVLKLQTTDNERLFCLNKFKNSVYRKVIKKRKQYWGKSGQGKRRKKNSPLPAHVKLHLHVTYAASH